MKSNRNYLTALFKCKHHSGKTWVAYVTPSEALMLIQYGAKTDKGWKDSVYFIERKSQGNSNPTWFYFEPEHELKIELNKRGYNEI